MDTSGAQSNRPLGRVRLGIVALGVAASVAMYLWGDLAGESGQHDSRIVTSTAAVAMLMATLWLTEAVHLAVTALIPVEAFPLLGIMGG